MPDIDLARLRADAENLARRFGATCVHDPRGRAVDILAGYALALCEEVELLRGAMNADDERLCKAAEKVWGRHDYGCDTPEFMAELIVFLRARLDELEKITVAAESEGYTCPDCGNLLSECRPADCPGEGE